jgi:hypothetical protein
MASNLAPKHFRKSRKYEKNNPYSGEDPADNVATTTEHEKTELLLRDKRRSTSVAQQTHQEIHRDLVMLEQNEAFPTTLGMGRGAQTGENVKAWTQWMASSAV